MELSTETKLAHLTFDDTEIRHKPREPRRAEVRCMYIFPNIYDVKIPWLDLRHRM